MTSPLLPGLRQRMAHFYRTGGLHPRQWAIREVAIDHREGMDVYIGVGTVIVILLIVILILLL